MKITELFEDRYFDKWAKEKAAENRARNKLDAPPKPPKPAKEPRPKKEPVNLGKIWMHVETAIGDSFPDGDPIDHIKGPKDQWGHLDMDLINKAVKQYAGRGKKAKYGLYDYLADMWDDHQADRLYDAREALKRKDPQLFGNYGEPFFHVDGEPELRMGERLPKDWDGWDKVKIVPASNPWK
jgi:hypothetical protein